MKAVALKAFPRTLVRRAGSKKLRSQGRIPAVIYGVRRKEPASLELDARQLGDLLQHSHTENLLVDLSVDGDSEQHLALLKEVQRHPLSGSTIHVDLHEVATDEEVTLLVPVETTGDAVGVKTGGGVLEHVLFKVKVRAKPMDLPEAIILDVTNLEVGQSIHLGDIPPIEGCEFLGEKTVVLVSVAAPLTEAEETAAAEAAAETTGEVEVLKEKKEEPEAAAGKPAADKK